MDDLKRQFCKVKHDPENNTYGDCLRACVATLVGHDVPHFFEDGCDSKTANNRLREYLRSIKLASFSHHFDSSAINKQDLFNWMKEQNPDVKYMLFCKCEGEDHVVICRDDAVLFNPAWTPYPVSGPNSSGYWTIMILVNL